MAVGIISIVSLSCYTGIVIFAAFHDCDPLTTKVTKGPRTAPVQHLPTPLDLPNPIRLIPANNETGPTAAILRDGDSRLDPRIARTICRRSV